ncbi:hypothetical protein EAE96_002886 [Botrytis aclada]|nr:hypothetical protein EAE96_002886 [Botrytis aclada]
MCKDCPPLNPWEEGYQDNRDPRAGTFEKFSLLPVEVQCHIFKQALPNSQIIKLAFKVTEERYHITRVISRLLVISIPTNPTMLPLLQACANSRAEVYRNSEKIEIGHLGTNTPLELSNPVMGAPSSIHGYRVVKNSIVCTKPDARAYTYMRPNEDILMIDALDVLTLYSFGGTISMSKIKFLALKSASLNGMSWKYPGNTLDNDYELHCLHMFFKIISLHCPALSKVHFLLDDNHFTPNQSPTKSQKLELRILDMDSEFFIQDFTGMGSKYEAEEELELLARADLQGQAKDTMRDWKQYKKAIARDVAQDGDVVDFWKTREPIVSVMGWFHEDSQDEFSAVPRPRMYVPSLTAWLPAHADGTIVDKYKGLAQIFDGAPW